MSGFGGMSLLDLFRMEAEAHGAALSEGLLALEKEGAQRGTIDGLMRAAHSIKGAARIVGLDPVVTVAHALEDAFLAARDAGATIDAAQADRMLSALDFIGELNALPEEALATWLVEAAPRAEAIVRSIREPSSSSGEAPTSAVVEVPSDDVAPTASGSLSAESTRHKSGPPPAAAEPGGASPASQPEAPTAAAPAASAAPGSTGASTAPTTDGSVRVSAESLTRLLELASASTVEASRFQALRGSLSASLAKLSSLERRLGELREARTTRTGSGGQDGDPLQIGIEALAAAGLGLREALGSHLVRFDESARRVEELSGGLFAEILRSRMRPFAEGTVPFPRMVRDLARQLGKRVEFRVEGEQVLVDREILRKLEAPLTHMLRNSIDHGIELPEDRRAAGKPETATLILQARHESGALVVEVRDDGRGIDPESVRRRIVERSMVDAATAARLSVPELMDFLFLPGFSTKKEVTEISGRGVGLDVVQSMVHAVSGAVSVQTELGRGIRFTMRLPVTLSVVRAAVVEASGALLAFPLARLSGVEAVEAAAVAPVQGRLQYEREGRSVGLLHAGELLELPGAPAQRDLVPVILMHSGGDLVGLVVDRILGEEDLAVRPLDPRLGQVPHVAAAAVRSDGEPALLLDVDDLARSLRESLRGGRTRGLASLGAKGAAKVRRILVVDDSITVREVERQLLQRRGFLVDVAVDGRDGFNALRTRSYDLLVTDVDMPRMNGIELVRAVRREPRLADLPIVIVSYKDRESDRLAGLDAGANAYLTKGSFQDDSFTATVEDLLAGGETS